MPPRKIRIQETPTKNPTKAIVCEIRYDVGGPNYFSGGMIQRGYYISAFIERTSPDGTKSLLMGEGYQTLLEPAARFNAKKLQDLTKSPKLPENIESLSLKLSEKIS